MSAPFDLSDALKKPPVSLSPKSGGKPSRRPPANVQLDDFARKVIWLTLAVCLLSIGYLAWGLYSGAWADPQWKHAEHGFRLQQLANIDMVADVFRFASIALIAAMVVVFHYDEGAGFALLGVALIIYAGLPLMTSQVFSYAGLRGTMATEAALRNLQDVGVIYGIPGLIWSIVDIVRRFKAAADAALVKQANQKYAEAAKARALGGHVPARRRLTPYQKQQRRYQILAVMVIIGEPLLVYLNVGTIQVWLQGVLALTQKLSFTTSPAGLTQLHGDDGSLVLWTLLIALSLVVVAQSLRLLEYICFREVV